MLRHNAEPEAARSQEIGKWVPKIRNARGHSSTRGGTTDCYNTDVTWYPKTGINIKTRKQLCIEYRQQLFCVPSYSLSVNKPTPISAQDAMSPYDRSLNAIIIGAGPAGIAMAYRLKHDLKFEDFTVYEKLHGVGGTWRTNTYPGWYVNGVVRRSCLLTIRCWQWLRLTISSLFFQLQLESELVEGTL